MELLFWVSTAQEWCSHVRRLTLVISLHFVLCLPSTSFGGHKMLVATGEQARFELLPLRSLGDLFRRLLIGLCCV